MTVNNIVQSLPSNYVKDHSVLEYVQPMKVFETKEMSMKRVMLFVYKN